MSEKKTLGGSVVKKVVDIIESLKDPYPDAKDVNEQGLLDQIEFLKRAATAIFVINFSKIEDDDGFIEQYNVSGVIANLMKRINPEIYSEFFFLHERGII